MSKLQDNRTTPQFMAMLGKMGVFSYLEFTLSTDQIFISQNAVGNSTLLAASFILFWSSRIFCLQRNMRSRVEISLLISFVTQCLKITENVSFNIASEASYGCILSVIENAINTQSILCGQIVLQDVRFEETKIGGKCQNSKFKYDIFGDFQTMSTLF